MYLSKRFLLGLALIIGNFILGKLALPVFAVSVELGLAIYLVSWAMLILGLILCGREGLMWAQFYYRYFEIRFKTSMTARWRKTPNRLALGRSCTSSAARFRGRLLRPPRNRNGVAKFRMKTNA